MYMITASWQTHPSLKDTPSLAFSPIHPLCESFFLYHVWYLKACLICVGGLCFAKKKRSLIDLFVPHPIPMLWKQSIDLLCSSGKRNGLKETGCGCDRVVVVCSCGFIFCFWFSMFVAHSKDIFGDCIQARGERCWLEPSMLSFLVHWLALMWARSRPLCFGF